MIAQKVLIECREVTFLISANIPVPKYRIGQLVEVFSTKDWQKPDEKCWFPCRITGMAWYDYNGLDSPIWEYQVKFLNCSGMPYESFFEDEMCLLEDGLMLPSFVANKVSDQC
ncbi:MAG: hypothetical protein ACKPEN_00390 [Planktothrix sp.]|uniref:hypothetical protein n=1 Tax=Planktothrix sp. TaxID=3088171 RepID=UPI0038D434FC